VTDITYIRTLEGFAYLAVVIDLSSHRVVGWSIQCRQTADVVLQALHMAVWRRKPKQRVLVHSDQGSQFTSMDRAVFIRAHNLEHSMSRRGNCHDNAVAESFFSSLKRERARRRTYKTREDAPRDVFDNVEMFYNPVRKHVRNGMLSPVEFERQQTLNAEGVEKTRGYSGCVPLDAFRNARIDTQQYPPQCANTVDAPMGQRAQESFDGLIFAHSHAPRIGSVIVVFASHVLCDCHGAPADDLSSHSRARHGLPSADNRRTPRYGPWSALRGVVSKRAMSQPLLHP
jgi:hypothetical protein